MSITLCNLILALGTKRLLNKGCQGFLIIVKDIKSLDANINEVLIMNEFVNVFLKKLLRLPLEREIYFYIDLVFYTQLISIPLYCMALAKFKKLKD